MQVLKTKIVIVGGGIAGLWAYRLLWDKGYKPLLLEKGELGGAQTLASQGMVHGGQRYQLQGKASEHGNHIAKMPALWQTCFQGQGVIDLSNVKFLSQNQYMWSPGGLASQVAAFMASKSMNSKVQALKSSELPDLFRCAPSFKGKVYRMNECVLDVKSLLKAVIGPYKSHLKKAEVKSIERTSEGKICLTLSESRERIAIEADSVCFTAGIGNEVALQNLQLEAEGSKSQRRPLKQIMIKGVSKPCYAHCITTDPRPRVTITAHPDSMGTYTWYLGGIVAEYGVSRSDDEAIANAKKEVAQLFPWMDWTSKEWSCLYIDRAEPFFDKGFFQSGPELLSEENVAIAWPTKLTFAPAIGNMIVDWVQNLNAVISEKDDTLLGVLSCAEVGLYPWEVCPWSP
ncbi:MAG: FAD-dependent oxidoreductase [Bdellovibrionota bacterium]